MADMFPVPSTQDTQSKISLPTPIAPVKPIPPVTSNIQQPTMVGPGPTTDSVSATNKVAIGWSPDQARQGLDITAQRTDAEKKRVYKQAQLQVLEQLNQQIKTTEGEIATESSAISQLQGEIGSLTGQVSSMQNEASSLESQIAAARAAARRAAEAAEAARQAAQRQRLVQQQVSQQSAQDNEIVRKHFAAQAFYSAARSKPNFVEFGTGVKTRTDGKRVRVDETGRHYYEVDSAGNRVSGGVSGTTAPSHGAMIDSGWDSQVLSELGMTRTL